MRTQILTVALFASTLALHVACGSDDSSGATDGTSSSGGSSGTSSGGTSSSGNGSSSESSGGEDGGDSGPPPLIASCDAPVRVDTLRGVNGTAIISATGHGNKWAATWYQAPTVADDGQAHYKGRVFDGAAMKTEQDLGIYDEWKTTNGLVSDGNGHAFVQAIVGGSTGRRFVVDFAAGTFDVGSPFTGISGTDPWGLAAIPGGGAISVFRDGTSVLAERWLPAEPSWKATNLGGAPSIVFGVGAYATNGGKGAAHWFVNNGPTIDIAVAFFDGTSWGTLAVKSLSAGDGGLNFLEGGIFSNGDLLYVYTQGSSPLLHTVRVHASDGTIDPVVDIGSATSAAQPPGVIIDPSDRVSIAYIEGGKAKVARNVGAGFQPAADLGLADSYRIDRDPTTNDLYLLTFSGQDLHLFGVPVAGASWSGPVVLAGVGIPTGMKVLGQTAMVFDSTNKPTVFTMHQSNAPGGLELVYVKCK